MRHSCSCGRCCQRCSTGIGKKVQYFYRASCISDLIRKPVPVHCLFRKKPRMLKAEGFQIEAKLFISDLPLFGRSKNSHSPPPLLLL